MYNPGRPMGLTLVIPCYNEEESVPVVMPRIIEHARARGYHIVVVDDGSKDGTAAALRAFDDVLHLRVVRHKVNRGYGAAIKTGMRLAETGYAITIDADGQHRLEDVDALYDLVQKTDADLIVGSRRGLRSASRFRGLGKVLIRFLARRLMPLHIHDLNSGMKLYRTELVQEYLHLCPDGMAFSDIITLIFINQKHLVTEHPIVVHERIAGTSTIGVQTAFQTILEIVNIIMFFNPLRLFLPVSLVFFVLGVVWGIPFILNHEGVSVGASLLILISMFMVFLGLLAEQLAGIRKRLAQLDGR